MLCFRHFKTNPLFNVLLHIMYVKEVSRSMHFVYSWYLAFWISSQSKSLIIDSIPSLHFFGAILFFVCLVFIWQNVKGIQVRFMNGLDLQRMPHNIYVSLFQRKTEFWRFLVLFSRSEMCINYEPDKCSLHNAH